MIDVVDLSRLQFALTAMYHFLFVPLTLGILSFYHYGIDVRNDEQANLQGHDQVLG